MLAECEEPALIITGGRDIQVTVDNGEALVAAAKNGRHVTMESMCHVLKEAKSSDRVEQLLSVYIDSKLPLTEALVPTIVEFMNNVITK
jgi:hypothetical protein